jgi:hypothetical protein
MQLVNTKIDEGYKPWTTRTSPSTLLISLISASMLLNHMFGMADGGMLDRFVEEADIELSLDVDNDMEPVDDKEPVDAMKEGILDAMRDAIVDDDVIN